jgi:hypothetical protein
MEQCVNEMPSMIRGRLKKLRLASGLLLLLLAMAINVQASSYSESVKFDLKMNKVSLKEVFQTITVETIRFQMHNNRKPFQGKLLTIKASPLPGVAVVVKGTTVGVVTDIDGNYSWKYLQMHKHLRFRLSE